jgi:hypothetical protein
VETGQGYADDLYAAYRNAVPDLQLAKLGCPGETTSTMAGGGVCSYSQGTQLAEAVRFLRSHRVALVTLDIGANNIVHCVSGGAVDQTCVAHGVSDAARDLPVILEQLRAAAGPGVRLVGMNYYDAFLAAWLQGPAGQTLASESVQLAVQFNTVLGSAYGSFQIPVADVQSAYRTTDFTPVVPFNDTPLNVAVICAWTWMCTPAPVGPNIHATALGYAIIAVTFVEQIGLLSLDDAVPFPAAGNW